MPKSKFASKPPLDDDPANPTRIFSLKITQRDHEGLIELARKEDRFPSSQVRFLIRQAVRQIDKEKP